MKAPPRRLGYFDSRRAAHLRTRRGSSLFTFLDDKITDLLELRADIAGDDAFIA